MKTVYWSAKYNSNLQNEFIIPILGESLFDYLKNKKIFTGESISYFACPASKPGLQNTYLVKNELKVNIKYTENGSVKITINNDKIDGIVKKNFIKDIFFNRNIKERVITMQYNLYLFCEDSLEVEQHQPWWDNTEYSKNTAQTYGKIDISKWLRPIQPTFACFKDEINIEQGDALYYVKFNTDEKIKFKEFNFSPKLEQLVVNNVYLKFFKPFFKIADIYDLFIKRNMNKKILKEIKNNLV